MKKVIAVAFILVNLSSCKNDKPKGAAGIPIKYSTEGRYLVKELSNAQGVLVRRQYCNADTAADGPMIDFYPDGKIAFWHFFKAGAQKPTCSFEYTKEGLFGKLKGAVILDAVRFPGNNFNIKFPNPPKLSFIIKYRDYYKDKIVVDRDYEPLKTDSCCWIGLSNLTVKEDHVYKFAFCVVDTAKHKIMDMYSEQLLLLPAATK